MKISKLKDQIQGLGEVVFDSKLNTFIFNALHPIWSIFVTNIYSRKGTSTFNELRALCVLEKTILKYKYDTEPNNEQSQYFDVRSKKKFGRFEPHWKYNNNNNQPC